MNIFIEKHQQLIKELLDARVEFMLIGGYAEFITDTDALQATWIFG